MTGPPDERGGDLPVGASRAAGFDASYEGTPPWDIGHPQPAFLALARSGAMAGRVLDIGCGTGEHALLASSIGLEATGIDASPRAIRLAEGKARQRHLPVRFLVGDALRLASRGEQFETVLDCGLFHVFDDRERAAFVRNLHATVAPGGRYFMLCFSDLQPGEWGPRRVGRSEVEEAFADGWRLESVEATRLELTTDPGGAQAWSVTAVRS